jgi:hypothetical protein
VADKDFVVKNGLVVGGSTRIRVPSGNTAQRPASAANGDVRFNTDTGFYESYYGANSTWGPIASTAETPDKTISNTLTVGNSTVNVQVNSTSVSVGTGTLVSNGTLVLGNTTSNLSMNGTFLVVGNSTVNGSGWGVGNSTIAQIANATTLQFFGTGTTYALVSANGTQVGNSTVGTRQTNASFTAYSGSATASLGPSGLVVGSVTINSTGWAVGNVAANSTTITIGGTVVDASTLVPPVGTVRLAASSPGAGWLETDGSVYQQSSYANLYAVLGTVPDFDGSRLTVRADYTPFSMGTLQGFAGSGRSVFYSPGTVVTTVSSPSYVMSEDGVTWFTLWPYIGKTGTSVISYGNGIFVAGSSTFARVSISSDGLRWRTSGSLPGSSGAVSAIAIGNGTIIVGVFPTQTNAYVSHDQGATWSTAIVASNVSSLLYDTPTGVFLATVGGGIMRSVDQGNTWSQVHANLVLAIGYGNGVYSAWTNAKSVVISTDQGATWSAKSVSPVLQGLTNVTSFAYGNGTWVGITTDSRTTVRSTDQGATWTSSNTSGVINSKCLAYGNGLFVIGTTSNSAYTSPDGSTWTQRGIPSTANLTMNDLKYGNGRFVGLANNGSYYYSPDGITWANSSPVRSTGTSLVYGNGIFIDQSAYNRSTDGISWNERTVIPLQNVSFSNTGMIQDIWIANGTWVAVGNAFVNFVSTTVLSTSPDGVTWTARDANVAVTSNDALIAVAGSGTGKWLAVSKNGKTTFSGDNGVTWTQKANTTALASSPGLVYGNGIFAYGGTVTADNGNTWTTIANTTGWVSYGNGHFLAQVSNNLIAVYDGTTTTQVQTANVLVNPVYGNGVWIGMWTSNRGMVARSKDNGLTWQSQVILSTNNMILNSVSYGDGIFWVTYISSNTTYISYSKDGGESWETALSNLSGTTSAPVLVESNGMVSFTTSTTTVAVVSSSVYSYDPTTEFAVPDWNTPPGVRGYIKAS